MKIAIVGFGIEGRAAYEYWGGANNVTVCDKNEAVAVPKGVAAQLGKGYLQGLEAFDLVVRSPNVHPRDIVAANSETILSKVTTNVNEFFKVCPTKNIIGVTGTKGKGTTSTLITKMLEAAGKCAHLGGNIGVAPLAMLKLNIHPEDWVVLELSNFQLIDTRYSPPLAVCLMIVPEHLDWQQSAEAYVRTKQQLFRWQKTTDKTVYYAGNNYSEQVVSVSQGDKIPYMSKPGALVVNDQVLIDEQVMCRVSELILPGEHNWQNVCAAVTAVWQITQDTAAIRAVLTSFAGLPFRIEFRQDVAGIRYYNDSFASDPPATIAALRTVPGKKVVILGGHDRGLDMSELAKALQELRSDIRRVVIIGASRQRLAGALRVAGYSNFIVSQATTMLAIVHQATELAEPGDAILLSPAFPSFDMFKNFEDRGRQFNAAVEAL